MKLTPPEGMERILERLQEMREEYGFSSSDGSIRIQGDVLTAEDKLILVNFIDDVRARVYQFWDIPKNNHRFRTVLNVQQGETDAPCRLEMSISARDGVYILITNFEKIHPPDLTAQLCIGFLRLYQGEKEAHHFPQWFGIGTARFLDVAKRQQDFDSVWNRWRRADLPPVQDIIGSFSPFAMTDPALAAQLTVWILDTPERGQRMEALKNGLKQEPWSPTALANIMQHEDVIHMGIAWDMWLLERRWIVLTTAADAPNDTPELVERLQDVLRVHAGEPGTPMYVLPDGVTLLMPRELIPYSKEEWMKATANAKIATLSRLGAGRSDEYRKTVEAYIKFFAGLREKLPRQKLEQLLKEAERLYGELGKEEMRVDKSR